MGSDNRRERRERARQQRRQGTQAPLSQIEFPGIMGWMQRNGRILFIIGIMFMILSVGAGAFASNLNTNEPDPTPVPTDTPAPTDTAEATPTEDVINRQYSAEPEMSLEDGIDYQAVIRLEKGGEIKIDLLEDESPVHVNNFVFLAKNHFYDGLTFHRVLPGFVAQAGDPTGGGAGGPGYFLTSESNTVDFERGALAMAKSSRGVSGSQFFITTGPTPHLNGEFTVFGWVTEGMGVVDGITPRDPDQRDQPRGDVIAGIDIIEAEKPEAESTPDATGTAEPSATATGAATASATPTPTGTPNQ